MKAGLPKTRGAGMMVAAVSLSVTSKAGIRDIAIRIAERFAPERFLLFV